MAGGVHSNWHERALTPLMDVRPLRSSRAVCSGRCGTRPRAAPRARWPGRCVTAPAGNAGSPRAAGRGDPRGGSPEAMRDGLTGTLVDPAAPPGLARAIAPYLRAPALA